jgi:threonine-phosphate decarboxylase
MNRSYFNQQYNNPVNYDSHGGNIYRIEKELGIPAGGIIDFSVNINPLGISPLVKRKILEALDLISSYPDPEYSQCRQALASYHGIPYENIMAGNGATELMFLLGRVLRPAKTLILAPTFSEYARMLELACSDIKYFRLDEETGFTPDIPALKEEIRNGYDLLVICNPNNPTGTLLTREEVEDIAEHGAEHGSCIMVDESFMEFVQDGAGKYSIINCQSLKNIFVIRSLTKILAIPGLRLGYSVCHDPELNREMASQKEPWSLNMLAACAAVEMPGLGKYLEETRETVAREGRFLCENLVQFRWLKVFTPTVNYMIIKILNAMTSHNLKTELLKKRILIRDASNFRFLNDKFIRIAIKDRESNKYLIESLKSLKM